MPQKRLLDHVGQNRALRQVYSDQHKYHVTQVWKIYNVGTD